MISLLSSIFAAIVAVLATIAIERFGGKLGGVLGSIPTTIVPASIGMWFVEGAFANAMFAVPVGMLVNACFLACWRFIPPYLESFSFFTKLVLMIFLSLSCWGILAYSSIVLINSQQEYIHFFGWLALFIQVIFGIAVCWNNPPSPKGKNKVGIYTLIGRGILAGCAIGFSILIANAGHAALAGIASVFPAIFLTTMISVWISQGEAVQAGAVGPMMLGSSAVSLYALLSVLLFPLFSWTGGGLVSWCLSIIMCSYSTFWWLSRHK